MIHMAAAKCLMSGLLILRKREDLTAHLANEYFNNSALDARQIIETPFLYSLLGFQSWRKRAYYLSSRAESYEKVLNL